MKLAVLTSSRADYGIYLPLIRQLARDMDFELSLLVFGEHMDDRFGKTINSILIDGFKILFTLDTLSNGDSPKDITLSMGKTLSGFARLWEHTNFDLIFALGDRYEMFAAVASSVPFNIPVAHIHGGETTLGATDNVFRHSITCMAKYHFTSTDFYKNRVEQIIGSNENVYNVGALSIDMLKQMVFLSIEEFHKKYNIDLSIPTILITFHPETINIESNRSHISELVSALKEIKTYQLVITMPNSDTMGLFVRKALLDFAKDKSTVYCIESFGSIGYLSCMKYCSFMLGNSSSGFVEASFFPKYVINLGERQRGRILTPNIINSEILKNDILESVHSIEKHSNPEEISLYGNGTTTEKIIKLLKGIC